MDRKELAGERARLKVLIVESAAQAAAMVGLRSHEAQTAKVEALRALRAKRWAEVSSVAVKRAERIEQRVRQDIEERTRAVLQPVE